jgi:hypothetical protein
MPPRSMLAMKQQQPVRPSAWDDSGLRLRLVSAQRQAMAIDEPSPMMEAIRKYLDSLP